MAKLYVVSTWGFDNDSVIEKALEELNVEFLKVPRKTDWSDFRVNLAGEHIVALSERFDVMIHHVTGDKKMIFLDVRGGRFKQR